MAEEKKLTNSAPKSTVRSSAKKEAESDAAKGAGLGGLEVPTIGAIAAAPEVSTRPLPAPVAAKGGWWWGTGRRKRAVARVRMRPARGEGKFLIALAGDKTKTIEQYFAEDRDRAVVYSPLKATGVIGKIDVVVRVAGGGYMGQAGAIMLGLARALKGYDPQMDTALRAGGFLTRDAREVERKKYGQAGARRRFQFSKR
ncbi:MAG: 30S ribosomal protein S9 [bacterium]